MKILGLLTTAFGAAVIAAAVVVVMRSAPDVRRYLKIRAM